jgi:lipopolysaccharide export system permease protein
LRNLLDKYVIAQILGPFGLFALIFTGVVWLTQSLRVIDTVVNSGQSALVFAEFTALLLPTVLSMVMPVAAFAATIFAVNRLFMESEIVVMMAAGKSRLSLARPIALFGLMVMAAMLVITLYLMPTASREMKERLSALQSDIASALIREGQFIHPTDGITVYVRETGGDGQMVGLFVQDDREEGTRVTYTAQRAALVRTDAGPRLVMFDGAAQRVTEAEKDLSVLTFDKLVYDLDALIDKDRERRLKPSEHYFFDLLNPTDSTLLGRDPGKFVAEGHEQISAPLYALALPLIAIAALLGPGFRRRGYLTRIVASVVAAALVRILGVAAKSLVSGEAALWPFMYAPPVIGVALALLVLWRGIPNFAKPASEARA